MFYNYLITALRNIARHKLYSVINIGGLAVGLACVILIVLFVRDELSYDKWIPGSDKLYRVETTFHMPGRPDIVTAQTTMPLTVAMHDQIPEVRAQTRLAQETMTLTAGDRMFSEKVGVVDPDFLQVVRLPLVVGDPRTVLSRPENLVLSQSLARKFFGDVNPIGKTLTTSRGGCGDDTACANATVVLKVVGVMRDLPHNTQLDFDALMPNTSLADKLSAEDKSQWFSNRYTFGYIRLAPGASPATVLAKLKPILDHSTDLSSFDNVKVAGSKILEVVLTPFQQVHMASNGKIGGMKPPGSWTTLYGLGAIAVLILLVACFNFINLATVQATMRAREVALRKCLGARRGQLVVQFLGESVLIALAALIAGLALTELLLPSYSTFMGRPLAFHYIADWPLTLSLFGIVILVGLGSGLYPALILSRFRPASAIRANTPGQGGAGRLRATLVVLQFAVSIGLGIGAMTVFQQIDFARHVDLGFRRDNVVVTGTGGKLSNEGVKSFMHALERGPNIIAVTRSGQIAFNNSNRTLTVQKPGAPQVFSPNNISVAPNYFAFYGIRILAGRVLSDKRADDVFYDTYDKGNAGKDEGHNVMVNAALVKALGYSPAGIIGKTFIFGRAHMRVVGVAADVLFNGVRTPVTQTVYTYAPDPSQTLSIRIRPEHMQEAMAYIDRVSRTFIPGVAPSLTLLTDSYARLYQSDERQGRIFSIFVCIAIFIACLGLFGLAAFTAGRRTREIGIRKVFGARSRDVLWLLLWQFSIPVLLANLIAWPIAWYYLHYWLEGFAYRIALNPLYFITAGLAALLIAWATIFAHALRVARANPVHALRHE